MILLILLFYAISERFEVTLNGNGFMKTDNTSQVACNFKLGEKNQSMWRSLIGTKAIDTACDLLKLLTRKKQAKISSSFGMRQFART